MVCLCEHEEGRRAAMYCIVELNPPIVAQGTMLYGAGAFVTYIGRTPALRGYRFHRVRDASGDTTRPAPRMVPGS